jgi:SNF2 family DNA or RNA helicase
MTLRYSFRTQPYAHQRKALAKLVKLNGQGGLWMPMRTGKTKVAVDWAGIAYHNHDLRRVLIVCPISVIDVWRDEIAKHSPVPSEAVILRRTAMQNADAMRIMSLPENSVEAAEGTIHQQITFVIVNYEMVWRGVAETTSRGTWKKTPLDEVIARWKPDLVVADEAHRLKAHTSQQSKALARLGKAAPMRLALTGTPITKWPLDAYGIFRFIDPAVFPTKWRCWKKDEHGRRHEHTAECEGFADRYAEWAPARFDPRVEEVRRYINQEELVSKIRDHSYSIRLEDAFPDLPARIPPQDIKVALSPKARKVYNDMASEMIAEIEDPHGNLRTATADIILTKLVRLSQITSGFVKDEAGVEVDIDDSKLRACLDLIDTIISNGEKVVVFVRFVHDYTRLMVSLVNKGIPHRMLTGQTPELLRKFNIESFQTDPDVPVFIAQIQSGSVGIDLSAARLCIFYSLSYDWAQYAQACDRILNPRKPRPLGIYRLLCPNTVDMVQRRVLDERGSLAEAIIHSPRSLVDSGS